MAKYGDEILKLSHIILAALSRHSNLPDDYILQRVQETKPGGVRTGMNYYPPCPQPDLVMGLSSHADGSVVTIVQQDGVSGLEVLKDEMWVPVPPVPNALVINIGDQIQVTHIPAIAFFASFELLKTASLISQLELSAGVSSSLEVKSIVNAHGTLDIIVPRSETSRCKVD